MRPIKAFLTAVALAVPASALAAQQIAVHRDPGCGCCEQWAVQVRDFVRGLSPYPAAWTKLNGKNFKVYRVEALQNAAYTSAPGTIHTDNKNFLHVQTAAGAVSFLDLQMEGKKRMPVQDLLRGYNFEV